MTGPPPLRGYPVDSGLRRSASAARRRPGILARLVSAVGRREAPARPAATAALREPCTGTAPR